MQCKMCINGEFTPGKKTVMLEKDETIIVFKGVPALVCDQCGGAYTDEDIADRLLHMLEEEAQKGLKEAFIQYVA